MENAAAQESSTPDPVVTDANIIKEAIDREGKLSVAALSLAFDLPVEQAKKQLERLHEKEVFEIRVSENGNIEYWLIDQSLLNG